MIQDTWVIIPVYNEEHSIAGVLDDLASYPYHVVVVDDGSQDHTDEIALSYPVTVNLHGNGYT